ncbi:hypothetical protein AZE42_01611 [Rhizopogon vesiculosus]|uniref:Uncharacterized protein n=1 Tax=Rhizopogon vesiculosus TaxID=180088 RepID=A0A1J8R9G7_9AGAM|nr:hypothetical protein AZE42_01611 [Rhizopogon vesiculosus]
MEDGSSPAASSSLLKARDLSLPKKPIEVISPPPKNIKKESPPLPPPRPTLPIQSPPSNSSSKTEQRPKSNGVAKVGRKSPIYTSSDEREIPEPPRKFTQDSSVNADHSKGKDGRTRPRSSYPPPPYRHGLRSRYQSKYGHYLDTYSKIVVQKPKIEPMLNGESEAEGEIMDPEELKRLSTEHKNRKEELEFIQDKWMNGVALKANASLQPYRWQATSPPSNSPSKAEQRPKPNGVAKARRKSPIYTSSDEGEIPEPPRKFTQDSSVNADRSKGKDGRTRPRSSYPLPPDRHGLRSRYQSKYGHYLDTYSKIVTQKRKIEAILNGESEAEGEIMDPEELKRLSTEHKNQKEELEFIQDKWMNGSVSE